MKQTQVIQEGPRLCIRVETEISFEYDKASEPETGSVVTYITSANEYSKRKLNVQRRICTPAAVHHYGGKLPGWVACMGEVFCLIPDEDEDEAEKERLIAEL
ncbi:hypothetical protein NKR19_g5833 [Coniochaeta hoffmannii]|uniref:Uncharacterized protein n=1 Tax=Coniochaeta hoffmannii TaxID=91930 RepID=A0AA38VK57_9PEZI|nr:hypothetical protein NKR19_g5833 [Coniochaeta hoffmannii]